MKKDFQLDEFYIRPLKIECQTLWTYGGFFQNRTLYYPNFEGGVVKKIFAASSLNFPSHFHSLKTKWKAARRKRPSGEIFFKFQARNISSLLSEGEIPPNDFFDRPQYLVVFKG